jgi:DNA-binding transcriptional regulator LsrR (DeoR family)
VAVRREARSNFPQNFAPRSSRIKARCANLLAPAVLSNTRLREELLAEPPLVNQFKLIRSANRVLFGVGDVGKSATLRAADLASREEIDAYVKRGAAGVLIGRFIDSEGRHMIGDLDSRMIGITLEELKALPNRLCVAGGPAKKQALRAALRGGYIPSRDGRERRRGAARRARIIALTNVA